MQRACALSVTVAGCLPCRRVAAAGTVVQVLGSLLVRLRACQSSAAAGAPGQGAGSQDAPQAAMSSHATPAAPRNSGVAAQNQPNTMATALLRRGAVGVAASAAARRPGSVVPVARLGAGVAPRPARAAAAAPAFSRRHSVACAASAGDEVVSGDSLGDKATTVRNLAFASFWVQLPLTIVSACILIFAITFSRAPSDVSRWFTLFGIAASFISTFFAHGFLSLAKKAINEGKAVSRTFLVDNLVRNTNINLAGIGITLIGLEASVGTLVSKTMLAAANAPYAAPAPGGTLISLDVFSLQASTNTLLAHFVSVVFANFIIGAVNKARAHPAAA